MDNKQERWEANPDMMAHLTRRMEEASTAEYVNALAGAFVTKDSGQREEFSTGARRDVQEDKPRYDLISVPALRRLGELMARGAKKYGDRNWEKGMPISRFYASALRHLMEFGNPMGDRSEDHLAAVLFNVAAIIHMQALVENDLLPEELIDME